jgi:hypothetical protein
MVVSVNTFMTSAAVNSLPAKYGTWASRASTMARARSTRSLCRQRRRVTLGRLDAAQHHVAAQVRLQVAVGKVEPVQVVGKVSMLRRQRQPAAAMPGDDVLHDGARLGNLYRRHRSSPARCRPGAGPAARAWPGG